MPEGRDRHSNGPASDCEQVYYCAWCESSPSTGPAILEPGSRNFILNPSGEHGLAGWTQHNSRGALGIAPWQVEASEFPPDADTATNFVSSYLWSVQSQAVPMDRVLRHPARIEVRCRFTGRTDCPSVFRMEALVLGNSHPPRVLQSVATPELETSPDGWETARLEFPEMVDPAHCNSVVLVIAGKDRRFWAGNYGSKAAGGSVRVLGGRDELDRVLQPDANAWADEQERALQGQNNNGGDGPPPPSSLSPSDTSTGSSCSIA
jgi:hypothetical protein